MALLTGRSHDSSYFSQVAVLSELLEKLSLTYGEEGKVGQSGDKYNDEASSMYAVDNKTNNCRGTTLE